MNPRNEKALSSHVLHFYYVFPLKKFIENFFFFLPFMFPCGLCFVVTKSTGLAWMKQRPCASLVEKNYRIVMFLSALSLPQRL